MINQAAIKRSLFIHEAERWLGITEVGMVLVFIESGGGALSESSNFLSQRFSKNLIESPIFSIGPNPAFLLGYLRTPLQPSTVVTATKYGNHCNQVR